MANKDQYEFQYQQFLDKIGLTPPHIRQQIDRMPKDIYSQKKCLFQNSNVKQDNYQNENYQRINQTSVQNNESQKQLSIQHPTKDLSITFNNISINEEDKSPIQDLKTSLLHEENYEIIKSQNVQIMNEQINEHSNNTNVIDNIKEQQIEDNQELIQEIRQQQQLSNDQLIQQNEQFQDTNINNFEKKEDLYQCKIQKIEFLQQQPILQTLEQNQIINQNINLKTEQQQNINNLVIEEELQQEQIQQKYENKPVDQIIENYSQYNLQGEQRDIIQVLIEEQLKSPVSNDIQLQKQEINIQQQNESELKIDQLNDVNRIECLIEEQSITLQNNILQIKQEQSNNQQIDNQNIQQVYLEQQNDISLKEKEYKIIQKKLKRKEIKKKKKELQRKQKEELQQQQIEQHISYNNENKQDSIQNNDNQNDIKLLNNPLNQMLQNIIGSINNKMNSIIWKNLPYLKQKIQKKRKILKMSKQAI